MSTLGMPRILTELAEESLKDEETTTVAIWLTAISYEEPLAWVVKRAVRIAERTINDPVGHYGHVELADTKLPQVVGYQ